MNAGITFNCYKPNVSVFNIILMHCEMYHNHLIVNTSPFLCQYFNDINLWKYFILYYQCVILNESHNIDLFQLEFLNAIVKDVLRLRVDQNVFI